MMTVTVKPHHIFSLGKDSNWSICVSGLHLLPIQELHERPQHGVSICLCSVVVGWAFDLVEDLSHLTHAAGDTSLETGGIGNKVRCEKLDEKSSAGPAEVASWHSDSVCVVCVRYLLAKTVLKLSRTVLSFTCSSLRMSAASVSNYNTHTWTKGKWWSVVVSLSKQVYIHC